MRTENRAHEAMAVDDALPRARITQKGPANAGPLQTGFRPQNQ
jgi:hypothetical protein